MLGKEVLQHQVHGIKAEERSSLESLDIFFPISHHSLTTSSWRAPPSPLDQFIEWSIQYWKAGNILVKLQCDC